MIKFIDRPELKRAQVYSEKLSEISNFVAIYNAISKYYINHNWIKTVKKNNIDMHYIDVMGKCYNNFNEALEYYKK